MDLTTRFFILSVFAIGVLVALPIAIQTYNDIKADLKEIYGGSNNE